MDRVDSRCARALVIISFRFRFGNFVLSLSCDSYLVFPYLLKSFDTLESLRRRRLIFDAFHFDNRVGRSFRWNDVEMRDSQLPKANAAKPGTSSGLGSFFRRTFGMSRNSSLQKQSLLSAASASLEPSETVMRDVDVEINLSIANSSHNQSTAIVQHAQQPVNISKRRSTFGSRLSIHSLFYPSTYSSAVGGNGLSLTNANATNNAASISTKLHVESCSNRPAKMSRSTNDLQISVPIAASSAEDVEQVALMDNASEAPVIHRTGSTERLLTNENGTSLAPDRVMIFLDNKSINQVPLDDSPAFRSGSTSDHDQDSVANLSAATAASTSAGPSTASKVKQRECPLCLVRQPSVNFPQLSYCHHRSCHACLVQYLHMEILESRVNVTCPECNEPMHPNDIYKILSAVDYSSPFVLLRNHLIEKYEEFSVRRVLMSDPDTRWCPAPDCSYAVIATGCAACPELRCQRPGCGTLFCYHCKMVWHPNQTCDEARAQRGSFATSPIHIDTTIRPGDIKACPRCRTYIVKMNDGSCNHMICALCGAEFCWLCLREISDLHYLSPSGCTFWGKKPWSRKKKLLWQLGMLVGAPVGIALVAGLAVPAIVFGVPVWVGRKVHQKLKDASKARRRLAIAGSVFGSVLMSPVLASMAVGVGVPIMLAYVYGVVPLSLCRNGSCGVTASSSGVRLDLDDDILAMTGGMGAETVGIHEKAQLLKDADKQDASTVTGFSIHSGSTQHKLQIQADVCSTGTGAVPGGGLSGAKQRRSSMESGATASLCGERCFINYEEASTKALAGSTYCDDKSVHTMGSLLEGGSGAYYTEADQTSMKGLSGSVGCPAAETKSSKSVTSGGAAQLSSVDNASVVAMAGSICGVPIDVVGGYETNGQCSRCGGRRMSTSMLKSSAQTHHHHHHHHNHHVHIDEQFSSDDRERDHVERESSIGRHHSVEQRVTRFADDPCVMEVADVSQYGFMPIDEESNAGSTTCKLLDEEEPTTSSNYRQSTDKGSSLRRFLFLRSGTPSDDADKRKRSCTSVENESVCGSLPIDSLKPSVIPKGGTQAFDLGSSPSSTMTGDEKRCRLHREECQCDDAEFLLLPPDSYIIQRGRHAGGRRLSSLSSRSDSMKKSKSWSALLLDGASGNLQSTSSVAAELWSTVRGAFTGGGDGNSESGYRVRFIPRATKRQTGGGLVQRLRPGRRATVSTSFANVASTSKRSNIEKKSMKFDVASSCASLPDSYSTVPIPTASLSGRSDGRSGACGDGDVYISLPSRQRAPSDSMPLKPTTNVTSSGGTKRFSSTLVNIFKPTNDK